MQEFTRELEKLINKYSLENGSDTPDFLLASFLTGCLQSFNSTMQHRKRWRMPKSTFDQPNQPSQGLIKPMSFTEWQHNLYRVAGTLRPDLKHHLGALLSHAMNVAEEGSGDAQYREVIGGLLP